MEMAGARTAGLALEGVTRWRMTARAVWGRERCTPETDTVRARLSFSGAQ